MTIELSMSKWWVADFGAPVFILTLQERWEDRLIWLAPQGRSVALGAISTRHHQRPKVWGLRPESLGTRYGGLSYQDSGIGEAFVAALHLG